MHLHLLLLAVLQVQDEGLDKARRLLEESSAKLRAAPAVGFVMDIYQGEAGSEQARVPTRSRGVLQAPDRMRWEWQSGEYDYLQIYDGRSVWSFDRTRREWSRSDQYRASFANRTLENPLLHLCFATNLMKLLDKAKDVVVVSRKEGDATFDVLSWRGKDPYNQAQVVDFSFWFDAARLPRRFARSWERQGRLDSRISEYTTIDLAHKVDAETFAFKPPEGWKEKTNPGGSGDIPDSEEGRKAVRLLLDIHKAFSAAEALTYETEMVSESDGEVGTPTRTITTLKRGDLIRQEHTSEYGESLTLADGESMWQVMVSTQNYTRRDLTIAAHRLMGGVDLLMTAFFVSERPTLYGAEDSAVTQDTLEGEACDVLEWSNAQPDYKMKHRFWVGADRRPRLKTQEANVKGKIHRTKVTYKAYDVKPTIPKGHFTFKPGPDWTDRTDERFGESLIAVGKAAPDFEAITTGGETVKLSVFRGSPVVLVFGHFAHPSENTRMQEFDDEFAKRGVKVIGVSVVPKGPAPDPKKYTFTLVRLKDKGTAKAYGVDFYSSGMYLLDGDGKILASTYANDALKKAVADAVPEPK